MHDSLRLWSNRISTPIGEMILLSDGQSRLRAIDWEDHENRMRRLLHFQYGKDGFTIQPGPDDGGLAAALQAYFGGDLQAIRDLPVETGGTPFQRAVWRKLREIPCGHTISYAELARRVGRPAAVRAVGLANGSNPVGVVVPCHRVIGTDGSLTGYGGGLERKRWLLAHEGVRISTALTKLLHGSNNINAC